MKAEREPGKAPDPYLKARSLTTSLFSKIIGFNKAIRQHLQSLLSYRN